MQITITDTGANLGLGADVHSGLVKLGYSHHIVFC